jgi:hypothetical protein
MQAKEIEAKFMDVDIKEIRKKIKEHGGHKIHKMVMYKRYVFNLLDKTKKGYGMTKDDINLIIPSLTFKNIDKELKNYIKKS